jgi:SOS response regulatory protein OraA/RecX
MPRITALRDTRRGVAVELDGEAWRTLPADVVVRAGLAVGLELDRTRARTLRRELRRHAALGRAARSLRSRDRSARDVDARLERAGFGADERADALGTLERAGLVDDARYAAARAESLAERGWGDDAIAWQLDRAGVAQELAAAAVAALEPERDRARRLIERRGEGAATARFLARRGFSADVVEAAIGADG